MPQVPTFEGVALKGVSSESDAENVRQTLERSVAIGVGAVNDLTDTPTKTADEVGAAAGRALLAPLRGRENLFEAINALGGKTVDDEGKPTGPVVGFAAVLEGMEIDAERVQVRKAKKSEGGPPMPRGLMVRRNVGEQGGPPETGPRGGGRGGASDGSAGEGAEGRRVGTTEMACSMAPNFPEVAEWEKDNLPAVEVVIPGRIADLGGNGQVALTLLMARTRAGQWQPVSYSLVTADEEAGKGIMTKLRSKGTLKGG